MMDKVSLTLQAIFEPLNVKRYYEIKLGQNLFKEWELWTLYGRIGGKPQLKRYFPQSLEEALHKLKQIIKKRFNSKSRIGCNYCLQQQFIDQELELALSPILEGNLVDQTPPSPSPLH